MPTKIILAGEGGQGVQTIAKIISDAAQKSGKYSSYQPGFGVEQRGGVSLAFLQISTHPISYPRFEKAEIVVTFCNRAVTSVKNFIGENSLFIYDNSAIDSKHLETVKGVIRDYLAIPAQKLGREKFTNKVSNVILLGGIVAHLREINYQEFENAILAELAKKIAQKPEIKDLNINALKAGLELAEKFDKAKTPLEGVAPQDIENTFSKENITWTRFPEYCKGCGLCIEKCPVQCLKFSKDAGFLGNPLPEIEIEKCIGCQKCMQICPDGAIKLEK